MNRRRLTLVIGLAWLCAVLTVGAVSVSGSTGRARVAGPALQSIIDQQRVSLNIPGVAATVIFGDGTRWGGVSGQADWATASAVTRRTPFVVGSITKTFVAALILDLAEEGRLSIDDPLAKWLPDFPNAANLNLRQLLSHTSGLFDYFRHPDYNAAVFGDPSHQWTPMEILTRFDRPPYFAPGTDYQYSNTNYVLLGVVAEQVGGGSVGDQLRARFWTPLGLNGTYIQSGGQPPPSSAANGYLWSSGRFRPVSDASGYRPTRSAASVAWSVGDVVSTADDIARWFDALYGGDVLEAASLAEMLDWERYPGGGDYGLGTATQLSDGRRMFGHTGSIRGYVAAAWYVPSDDATIVVLTNRGRTNAQVAIPAALMQALRTDVSAPSVPANLTAASLGNLDVQLTWDAATSNVPGVVGYRLFRNGSPIGTRTTALSFSDRPPIAGTYSYQVRAVDVAGRRSAKSAPVSVATFP